MYGHWIPERTDEAIHELDRIGQPAAGAAGLGDRVHLPAVGAHSLDANPTATD